MANLTLYRPLSELRREVDRLFEDFFPVREERSIVWSPEVDMWETHNAYVLQFDLPGLTKKDVEITLENGTLQVSGERRGERELKNGQYHRVERWHGRFYRAFRLNDDIDPDHIKARFDNGVLTVRVPKTEESRPRRIEIS